MSLAPLILTSLELCKNQVDLRIPAKSSLDHLHTNWSE